MLATVRSSLFYASVSQPYPRTLLKSPRRHISISTSSLHPSIRDFTSALAQKQPCFAVSPDDIHVLSEPSQFYALLLDMISRAKTRIFISSLYLGSEESELISALSARLQSTPSLHLHLQLDLNRSTRPGPSSTASILVPLLHAFPSRVHVSLFRSPRLRGLMAALVPPRFNEGWGTWHAKIYGVDDEVMISGANLNKSYFTNRQDRYIHFTAQPLLAEYCFGFLKVVSSFSFNLMPNHDSMSTKAQNQDQDQDGYHLEWPDPLVHPHHIQSKAENALSDYQASYMSISPLHDPTPPDDPNLKSEPQVLIFPIIQAGQFNIREEEHALESLFSHLETWQCRSNHSDADNASSTKQGMDIDPLTTIDLTSGYFGLYKPYQNLIMNTRAIMECKIVASAPKANGFFGSRGVSGRIPEGYTLLEQRFMRAVERAGRGWTRESGGVLLSEWEKDGWTYHAKGIWLSPSASSETDKESSDSLPILTLFGSTNLNSRSANLDTELSFIMIVPSEPTTDHGHGEDKDEGALKLRRRLAEEVRHLREHAREWEGRERKVRIGTKALVALVGGML